MYKGKSIAIVVPAYNEETQLHLVFDPMPAFVDYIVVVNDCSKDRTREVIESQVQKDKRVVPIHHEVNQGVGGAIASGYKWARDNKVDIAVVMAGDGQMDPVDMPNLLDPVVEDKCDYSKGNRLVSGEAFKVIPKIRYFGNSALSLLTKIASGYWHVADTQTGYTAINQTALKAIDWDSMYKRYGQPNDLLVKLNIANMRVRDVPIRPVYNVGEKSGIKVHKVIFTIGWLIVKLFFFRLKEKYIIRDFHPLVFFYALGALCLGLSGVAFLRVAWILAATGHIAEVTFLGMLFCLLMGLHATFFAMWFDMECNKHLR